MAALAAAVALLTRGALAAYYACTDSFVAPTILTPDNDTVIQNSLSLNRLLAERQSLVDHNVELKSSIALDDEVIRRFGGLLASASAKAVHSVTKGQRDEMLAIVSDKDRHLSELNDDLSAGLVHKSDVEHEEDALRQVRVSLLQNDREQLSVREQVTRMELDRLNRQVDRRTKELQLQTNSAALLRMDKLLAQMSSRPIFRAMEKSQNVAFVPYKEIQGVRPGLPVYRCKAWSFLDCHVAGTVEEIVSGEVVAPDPWGTAARGRYAILNLTDQAAGQEKVLRIRRSEPWADLRARLSGVKVGLATRWRAVVASSASSHGN